MPVTYETVAPFIGDNRDYTVSDNARKPDGSIWGAAFRRENDMLNLVEANRGISIPERDPTFDLKQAIFGSEIAKQYPEHFVNAVNAQEFQRMEDKIRQELEDERLISQGGTMGVIASMAASVASPTVLLPAGAGARGLTTLSGAGRAAGWGAVGALAQEAILQQNQQVRSTQESLTSIATSTVLAGLLGGAVQYFVNGRKYLDSPEALSETSVATYRQTLGIGAEVATPDIMDPGPLEAGVGINTIGRVISPPVQLFSQQSSPTARAIAANVSTTGLKFEQGAAGKVAAFGGDIESRVRFYDGVVAEGQKTLRSNRAAYRLSENYTFFQRVNPNNAREFNVAVGDALFEASGNVHIDKAAEDFRAQVFTPFLEEAKAARLPGFDKIESSDGYITHIVKNDLVGTEIETYKEILAEHAEEVLREEWQRVSDRALRRISSREQQAEDLSLDDAAASQVREMLEREIAELPETVGGEAGDLASRIRQLRAEAQTLSREEAKPLREEADKLSKENKETLREFFKQEALLRARFRNLDSRAEALSRTQKKLTEQLNALAEAQTETINRALRSSQRFLKKLDKLSEEQLDLELEKLEAQFEKAAGVYERAEARIAKIEVEDGVDLTRSDQTPTDKLARETAAQEARTERMDKILARLDAAKDLDRTTAREAVENAMAEFSQRISNTVSRRSQRMEALRRRIAEANPNAVEARVQGLRAEADGIRRGVEQRLVADFNTRVPITEADEFPNPNFSDAAREIAERNATMHLSRNTLMPNIGAVMERGPMLARTLRIDPNRIWSNGRRYKDFLERDIEVVAQRYARTMGPDIEFYKKFGTVNPAQPDGEFMQKVNAEYLEALEAAPNEKARKRIMREQEITVQNIEAIVGRTRHTWGIPDDPNAALHRMGRSALNLNTVRFMGQVVVNSMADVAHPIAKFGLLNTFKDGWLPFVTNYKQMSGFREQTRSLGVAIDHLVHSRLSALSDIYDDLQNHTMAERALQAGANNMGKIALFDYWSNFMKQISVSTFAASMSRAIDVIGDPKASQAAKARAYREMSAFGLGERELAIIGEDLLSPLGGTRVNGALLPNTESWQNPEAVRIFAAAISRAANDSIITPGAELPKVFNKTLAGRLVFQLRSFTFSSTVKTYMAMSQDFRYGARSGDFQLMARPLMGMMYLLALGGLSYYLGSQLVGGQRLVEMQNAGPDKWADEAIVRSGVMGVFGEVHRVAERTPALTEFVTFSGRQTTRSPFVNPIREALGPTVGSLVSAGDDILLSLGEENQMQELAEEGRQIVPFQNHMLVKLLERMAQE